MLGDSRK